MKVKAKIMTAIIALIVMCGAAMLCTMTACGVAPVTVTLSETTATTYVGETVKLKATTDRELVEGEKLSWKSSNTSIATVSNNGTVTGKSVGSVEITVSVGESSATATVTVGAERTVTIKENGTAITAKTIDFDNGDATTFTLTAETSIENAEITWSSSDMTLATVEGGVVTVNKGVANQGKGTATITASVKGTNIKATVNLTVIDSSAPYDLPRGTSNSKVAQEPGVWQYFDKTSDGSTFKFADGGKPRYNDGVITLIMAQASATNTSSKRSEFYLRYQPNFEIGTEYTATVTFVATKDMSLKLGNLSADVENIVQFTANEEGTISNTFTVSDDMPLNIQLIFGEINEGDDPVTCTVKKVELTPVEA